MLPTSCSPTTLASYSRGSSRLTSLQWARDHGGRGHECIVPGFDDGVRASRDHRCTAWIFDDYRASGYVTSFSTNMCDWGVMEEACST